MLSLSLSTLTTAFSSAVSIFVLYALTKVVWNRFFNPLARFPGPFWGSITSLWYFRSVRYGIAENTQLALHKKYGPIVRIAPNTLSISDAKAIDVVYGPHGDKTFTKTKFYDGLASHISIRRDVFSERDEGKAIERRRMVAPIYSQSSILAYEPGMEKVTAHLQTRLEAFAETREPFDISVWLHKYGFDVIGDLFFGRDGGFSNVRDNIDYNGWCRCMETMPNVGAATTYMPAVLRPVWMIAELLLGGKDARDGVSGLSKVIVDAKQATIDRSAVMSINKHTNSDQDILSKLIAMANSQGPAIGFGLADAATEVWTSIWAGGDTTGTTLTAAVYYLHKYPQALKRLADELKTAHASGNFLLLMKF